MNFVCQNFGHPQCPALLCSVPDPDQFFVTNKGEKIAKEIWFTHR
jgi:hypothetical protein